MDQIALGSQGLMVSKLGYGCMGLTSFYGAKLADDEIVSFLHKNVYDKGGITFWDTATVYVYFDARRLLKFQSPIAHQDEIIAKAVKEVGREKINLCHKTGIQIKVFPRLKITPNSQRPFVRQECENALKRMGVEYIDLFYLHRIDQTVPIEVSMLEMKNLVAEGKVRYVGLSECSASTIRRAHKIHPITAVQMEYSLWCRGIEKEIVPVCKELGIGIVAYSPLGRGFFGGVHKKELQKGDYRSTQARFKDEKAVAMYDELEKFAKTKGVLPVQLALAWVMAQNDILGVKGFVPIPGTTKEKNLDTNLAAAAMTLSAEDIEKLESIVQPDEITGARYDNDMNTWETDNNPPLTEEQQKEVDAAMKASE